MPRTPHPPCNSAAPSPCSRVQLRRSIVVPSRATLARLVLRHRTRRATNIAIFGTDMGRGTIRKCEYPATPLNSSKICSSERVICKTACAKSCHAPYLCQKREKQVQHHSRSGVPPARVQHHSRSGVPPAQVQHQSRSGVPLVQVSTQRPRSPYGSLPQTDAPQHRVLPCNFDATHAAVPPLPATPPHYCRAHLCNSAAPSPCSPVQPWRDSRCGIAPRVQQIMRFLAQVIRNGIKPRRRFA